MGLICYMWLVLAVLSYRQWGKDGVVTVIQLVVRDGCVQISRLLHRLRETELTLFVQSCCQLTPTTTETQKYENLTLFWSFSWFKPVLLHSYNNKQVCALNVTRPQSSVSIQ